MTSINRRQALTGAAAAAGTPFLAGCVGESVRDVPQAPSGETFASTTEVPVGSGTIFKDAGVVVTQPTEGEFKAFQNACTHQGCAFTDVTDTINCNCHFSKFALEDGEPVAGPARTALNPVEVTVDGEDLSIA